MKKVWDTVWFTAKVLFGCCLFGISFNLFLAPHNMNIGGVSGLGMAFWSLPAFAALVWVLLPCCQVNELQSFGGIFFDPVPVNQHESLRRQESDIRSGGCPGFNMFVCFVYVFFYTTNAVVI